MEQVQNVEEKKNLYAHHCEISRKYFMATTLLFTGAYAYLWFKTENTQYLIPFALTMSKLPVELFNKQAWDDEEDQLNLEEKDNNRFLKK